MKIFRSQQQQQQQQQPKGRKSGDEMGMWFSLKRSLHCKSEASEVHDPKTERHLNPILTRKTGGTVGGRSGCSRSIANLKDVIHGSKRHTDMRSNCSPRSIGSSEFLNPITHEVILRNSRCELKISRFSNGCKEGLITNKNGRSKRNGCSTYVGTLRPGTPGPGGYPTMHYFNSSSKTAVATTTPRNSNFNLKGVRDEHVNFKGSGGYSTAKAANIPCSYNGSSSITCHKCGEQFTKRGAAESHHLSKHAVTELVEGDSSRKIVEIICNTSWAKSQEANYCRIERVFKVHNMQKTLARFEEYREMVKMKASKLPKKHPRCLADGNELLRFHGTTVTCGLGLNGRQSLCSSDKCSACRIIQSGFSLKKEAREGAGVFTASTSGRALESIELIDDDISARKALIVCRVIAGRIRRPVGDVQEITCQAGFDSLAGKVGLYSNIEELYLLNPRALLPCFVVICKQ